MARYLSVHTLDMTAKQLEDATREITPTSDYKWLGTWADEKGKKFFVDWEATSAGKIEEFLKGAGWPWDSIHEVTRVNPAYPV